MTEPTLLTTVELADTLDVHTETVVRWRAQGMPHLRRSGSRGHLHDLDAVRDWLVERGLEGYATPDVPA